MFPDPKNISDAEKDKVKKQLMKKYYKNSDNKKYKF